MLSSETLTDVIRSREREGTLSVGRSWEEMKDKMSVEDLNAGFGKKTVLEKISVGFKENSVTALIGPSGCGKSTFIRCLNRLHEVTPGAWVSGKIILDDDQILEADPVQIRRRIGMVFQRPNPFPTMSVFDNVAAGLKLNGVRDKKLITSRVEESLRGAALLDEVGDRLHRESGASLSGGQQQRLCIARTLAVSPEIVLMDEPCSALDPMATAKIEQLITQLKAKYTVIVVTHNMQQAARISDMTGFLYLGKLVEYGPTEQIFSNPQNELTERYISGKFG
jgi:phosphate transport system ATP-binding protein